MQSAPQNMIFYSCERQGTLGSAYDSAFGRSEYARESPGGSLCATSLSNGNPSDSKIVKKSYKKLDYVRTYSQRLCQRAPRLVFFRLEGHSGMAQRTFGLHRRERIAHGSFAPRLCQGMKYELLFGRFLNQLRCWSDPSATCC